MTASASGKRYIPGRTVSSYVVICAAALSTAALIPLVSLQMYPAAVVAVLLWLGAAVLCVIRSLDQAASARVAGTVLVVWFATTPVAWYFVRFPLEKSIVTYERLVFAVVGLLAFGTLLLGKSDFAGRVPGRREETGEGAPAASASSPAQAPARPNRITKFEIVWSLLTLLACVSALTVSGSTGYAFRTAIDAFGLPLIAFYGARTYLGSRRYRRYLVVAAMLLGLFLFVTGAFEFLSGINLLPYQGSEIIREGEPRVNGPFITDTSFAIVSLLLVLFLRSAPRMFNLGLDPAARVLYRLGTASAILACLLPLFRSVAFALAICWVIEGMLIRRPVQSTNADLADPLKAGPMMANASAGSISPSWSRRLQPVLAVVIVSTLLVAAVILVAPSNIRNRLMSPRNAYSRLLSWRLAANIIYQHPVFGVGMSNYVDYFNKEYSGGRTDLELELDTHIVRHPHSNLVWIAGELGMVGLALYLAAATLLLMPAWRTLKRSRGTAARAAAACFVVLLAAYWIPGLELTSGMYSELNIYFFFLLGLIYPLLTSEGPFNGESRVPNSGGQFPGGIERR